MSEYSSEGQQRPAEVLEFPETGSLEDQTAAWVSKLDSDALDEDSIAAFKQWCKQSPEHLAEFERHLALWNDMNVLTRLRPPERIHRASLRRGSMRAGWRSGLAFCVCALLVVTALMFQGQGQTYRTDIGEQKTVQLEDGTRLLLNTNTELRVRYSDGQRQVQLMRGEAHFDIAHDASRPFDVQAGEGLVRALGTAFSVYLKSEDVEVVVTEGEIAVLSRQGLAEEASAAHSQLLANAHESDEPPPRESSPVLATAKAGSVLIYDRYTAEHVNKARDDSGGDKLAWHKGMLVFRTEPLSAVIAELSRYTEIKIVIPEPEVRAIKVGGFFKVGDLESVFEALEQGFDIQAERVNDDVVYLVRREK